MLIPVFFRKASSSNAEPEITANNLDAQLIHEAAIGKIAGEQIIKLMTLGLTEAEAEETVFRYEYSLEKPEQVKKDIKEWNEKFYIKFVK